MSKRKKRLERIRNNPKNVSFDELRHLLEDYGFTLRHIAGSHYTFSVTIHDQDHLLVVPFNRPIKAIYVKKALQLIDKVIEEMHIDDEQNN